MSNKKFAVTYELAYTHRVVVGVTAGNAEDAIAIAEEAFDAATIWDNAADMPLLFDDFEEDEAKSLVFSAEEVGGVSLITLTKSMKVLC